MEDETPLTAHILRPHHVGLLAIFLLVFKEFRTQNREFPPDFMTHLYRVLLEEVCEVAQPKSLKQLIAALEAGPDAQSPESATFLVALTRVVGY